MSPVFDSVDSSIRKSRPNQTIEFLVESLIERFPPMPEPPGGPGCVQKMARKMKKPTLGSHWEACFRLAHIWHSNAGKGRASVVPGAAYSEGFWPNAER